MDEMKEEKKKESIDEILSDLNGLLNKMPAILEGIKLPEIKPLDFSDAVKLDIPAAAPEPATARIPELDNFPQKEDAFDKTMKLDESQLPGPAMPEEKDKLVLQSLGEYMFTPGNAAPEESRADAPAASFSVEPAGLDSAPELPEIKPIVNEVQPEIQAGPARADSGGIDDIPGIYSPPSHVNMDEIPVMEPETMDEEKKDNELEGTKDFGVPDIDAMIKLSMDEALPGKASEPAPAPEPKSDPDMETLIIEPVTEIVNEKGGEMEIKEEVPADKEAPAPQDAFESTLSELKLENVEPEPGLVLEPEPSLVLEPEPGLVLEQPGAVAAASDDEKTMIVSPPSNAMENTLSSQSGPAPEPQAGEAAVPAAEPQNGSPQEFIIDVKEPAPAERVPGLEIPNSAFGAAPVAAAGAGDEDKTMVIPPSASGGDADKTVIYEAGAAGPAITSRRREDLASMSSKQVPEGIPPERVRAVAFLYAQEDAALASDMLAELDAICLKSPSKPMFIQRAFVQICDPGMNGAVVLQKVTDAKSLGVVLLGEIPQENIYEIENAITAGGSFFRHLNREAFSHSAALDLVSELILK